MWTFIRLSCPESSARALLLENATTNHFDSMYANRTQGSCAHVQMDSTFGSSNTLEHHLHIINIKNGFPLSNIGWGCKTDGQFTPYASGSQSIAEQ